MRTPMIYSADQIKCWNVQSAGKNGLWTQARPCLGLESIYEKEYLPLGWFSLDRQMYWFGWETKNER